MPMTNQLAKELEIRLTAVEKQLKELVGAIEKLSENFARADAGPAAGHPAAANGSANGRDEYQEIGAGEAARLEGMIERLDERVEKTASTLVNQASRFA